MLVLCQNCKEKKLNYQSFCPQRNIVPIVTKELNLCMECGHLVSIDEYDKDTELCLNCFYGNDEPCQGCGEYFSTG